MAWRFVFVDESGDAGTRSPYFVAAAVDCSGATLATMRRLIAPYRHHLEIHKEVKAARLLSHERPRRKACEMVSFLMQEGVGCTVAYIDKSAYTGPYLGNRGMPPWPSRFRNFALRMLFERHFQRYPIVGPTELEIICDRVSMSQADRLNLERYLSGNRNLPTVHYFTHVDSEYTDAILWPDLAATLVKEFLSGVAEQPEAAAARARIHCVDVTRP